MNRWSSPESPIYGKEIINTKRDEVARDKCHLIWCKKTHNIEYCSINQGTCSTHNAETDELPCLVFVNYLLYLIHLFQIYSFCSKRFTHKSRGITLESLSLFCGQKTGCTSTSDLRPHLGMTIQVVT